MTADAKLLTDAEAAECEARAVTPGYGLWGAVDVGRFLMDRNARTALLRDCEAYVQNYAETTPCDKYRSAEGTVHPDDCAACDAKELLVKLRAALGTGA